MQLGMIGLGRMGANLVERLTKDGHECVVFDVNHAAVKKVASRHVRGAASIDDVVAKLTKPRAAWVMVPAAVAGQTVSGLASRMEAGDIIIDGGNSYYRDDIERAMALKERGIHYVDCGTSGGVFGLERGYCLMIGGEDSVVDTWTRSSRQHRTRGGRGAAHPRAEGARQSRRAGVPALRAHRRRPLREDGPQRHRVRADGGLRGGPQHPQERRCRPAPAGGGRGNHAAPRPRRVQVSARRRLRSPRCGGEEASSRRGCSTSPPRRWSGTPR